MSRGSVACAPGDVQFPSDGEWCACSTETLSTLMPGKVSVTKVIQKEKDQFTKHIPYLVVK